MRSLLVRCYPARWRERYGDEFRALLEDRPLGPFDVADVLLGALDAHLHLRGPAAASDHGRGFAMSLRIGGLAAIAGGALWAITLALASAARAGDSVLFAWLLAAGSLLLLVALVGLSAFQARRFPRLMWAAFIVPAVGSILSTIGLIAMPVLGDRPLVGDLSPWSIWALGTLGLLIGSALFGIATWRTGSLSRRAAALLVVGAFAVIPAAGVGSLDTVLPEALSAIVILAVVTSFGAGWTWLGVSAVRLDRATHGASLGGALP